MRVKGPGIQCYEVRGLGQRAQGSPPGDHFLLLVGGVATTAQHFGRCGQEIQAVVGEVLVDQREQDLGVGWRREEGDWVKDDESPPSLQPPPASEPSSDLGKEFNLLFMWGLFHSSTADHSLWWGRANRGHGGFKAKELRVF